MPDARLPKAVHVFQTPVHSVDAVGTTVELDDRLLAACEVSSRLLDQVVGRCLAAQFTTTSRIDRVGLAQATPRAPPIGAQRRACTYFVADVRSRRIKACHL